MHGFNQGSHTVRDLALSRQPDIFLLQEHWLTPANLDKLHELLPQYTCFCSSAMRSAVESGLLYGRPYGGVAVLVNNKLARCTEILCSVDRYIILSLGNTLIVNLYLPCAGTADRMDNIENIIFDVSEWIQKYNDRIVIIGGDFNTDLDKRNPASDFLNNFAREHALHRCTNRKRLGEKRFTFFNDTQGTQSEIDFFLCNDMNVVSDFDVLDQGCILSDHVPILVECNCFRPRMAPDTDTFSHSLASVSQLRWDHANLSLYRVMSEYNLQPVLQNLINLENYSGCNVENLEIIYRQIVDALKRTSDETIPTCNKNFFQILVGPRSR